jgi:hypothetical protein
VKKMDTVIGLLLVEGWSESGRPVVTGSGPTVRIARNRFVTSGQTTRRKFARGTHRCTVGKRTVCFYEVGAKGAYNFRRYRTTVVQ